MEAEQEKRKQEAERIIKVILSGVGRCLTRTRQCSDPVIRHTLLVDKLLLMVDGLISLAEVYASSLSEDTQRQVDAFGQLLQNDLTKLMEWIQSPVYGPDHPFGKDLMQQDKAAYTSHCPPN